MAWDDVAGKAAGNNGDKYVVLQVVLTEKLLGTGSGTASLTNLQSEINKQAAKGYRLHTISTTSSGSKGFLGGDKIQATMVFERIDLLLLKISRMHFPMHSRYFFIYKLSRRYSRVTLRSASSISFGVPAKSRLPPASPPPGPSSTI